MLLYFLLSIEALHELLAAEQPAPNSLSKQEFGHPSVADDLNRSFVAELLRAGKEFVRNVKSFVIEVSALIRCARLTLP